MLGVESLRLEGTPVGVAARWPIRPASLPDRQIESYAFTLPSQFLQYLEEIRKLGWHIEDGTFNMHETRLRWTHD